MRTLNLVTVVFDRDVEFFKLQLKSIAKFVPPGLITTFVVITQEDGTALSESLKPVVSSLIDPSIIPNIMVVPQNQLTSLDLAGKGWYAQQLLKLACASLMDSDDYVVLDAKVHFVKPVTRELFYTGEKPRAWQAPFNLLHEIIWNGYQRSCDEFAVDWTHGLVKTNKDVAPLTPFVFIKTEVVDMIATLEAKYNSQFDDIFINTCEGVLEFYLYSAFLKKKYGTMSEIYAIDDIDVVPHVSLYPKSIEDPVKFFKQVNKAMTETVSTFALHPSSTGLISDDMLASLVTLWSERGLLDLAEIKKLLNIA